MFWPQTKTDETRMGGRMMSPHMKPQPGGQFMCRPEFMWITDGSGGDGERARPPGGWVVCVLCGPPGLFVVSLFFVASPPGLTQAQPQSVHGARLSLYPSGPRWHNASSCPAISYPVSPSRSS